MLRAYPTLTTQALDMPVSVLKVSLGGCLARF